MAPWLRRLTAVIGIALVVLAVGTVVVQTYQAHEARRETDYARALSEWQNCRVDAITKSSVTDQLISYIRDANQGIKNSSDFNAARKTRITLDGQLADLERQRQQALQAQTACGSKPARPDGSGPPP